MSPDAKAQWITFPDSIEREQKPDGKYANIKAFASKAPEHCLRLAAVLTLFENPEATEVPVDKLHDATELIDFYLNENLRLSEMGHISHKYVQAELLAAWLQKRCKKDGPFVSLVEIYQKGPNEIRDPKLAKFLLSILRQHGFVRRSPDPVLYAGTKRREVYEIRASDSS